jgi:signal transduction histidine kinase
MLNDDGTMGTNETTLNIHISSPFWRTRWAILLYALALLGIGLWWRRHFLRRQQEQLRLEILRRETEKQQWMSEMRQQLMKEAAENLKQSGVTSSETSDSLKINPIVADLIGFLRQLTDEFKMPAEKRKKLSFNSAEYSLNIAFDPEQLGRAINILLNNSVNFTPSKCHIEVFAGKEDNQAVIRISDNGIGIPEEARSTMFEPHVGQATGTSLYDVKRIVEAHGGSVSVQERKKGGTVFTLLLPITQPDQEITIEEAVIIDD